MWRGWQHSGNGPAKLAADSSAMDQLRRAVAEELGEDPETWPAHGNTAGEILGIVTSWRLQNPDRRRA
jgi:hypothetical protein